MVCALWLLPARCNNSHTTRLIQMTLPEAKLVCLLAVPTVILASLAVIGTMTRVESVDAFLSCVVVGQGLAAKCPIKRGVYTMRDGVFTLTMSFERVIGLADTVRNANLCDEVAACEEENFSVELPRGTVTVHRDIDAGEELFHDRAFADIKREMGLMY